MIRALPGVASDDQVSLPVPGDGPVVGLGRAQTDGGALDPALAPGPGQSGQRGAGDAAGASGAQGLVHPQLGAQAAGALDVKGLVDLLVTDAHAPIIGVLEPQAGGDLPGTNPILQQVDAPLAQDRVGVQSADLGAGQPRPGRGLRRRGTVDPVRARPAADLAGHGLPAPAAPDGR